MRRCVSAVVFALLLFTGRTAFASSIAVGDTLQVLNAGGAIFGGVFQVHDVNFGDPADRIDLLTFCLQHEQDISIDDFTVANIGLVTDDGNSLDARTAWIYSQFSQGALPAIYTEDEIQAAIWVIEQQNYFINSIFPIVLSQQNRDHANALMLAAQQAVAGGYVNNDVRVLTLVYLTGGAEHSAGEQAQDLLVYTGGETSQDVHMPEPATLVLVGSGVVGLIRRHSKRRRTS